MLPPALNQLKEKIDVALDGYLPRQSDIAQPVVDAMRHSVLGGGKRLRPMLVCAATEACGGNIEHALAPACALEFVHAYSLIHDDLPAMDDDDIRHGLASAHIAFGEANAILAGDSLHSLAFQNIALSNYHSGDVKLAMISLLSADAGWAGMAGGQCLDIQSEGHTLDLERLKQMHAAKTGALIRCSLQIGALSAHNISCKEAPFSDEQMQYLIKFGNLIGLAFQVMDDVLDVTQTTDKLGKPAGSDEQQNKNTFPKLMGLNEAKSYAHELVQQAHQVLHGSGLQTATLAALAQLVVDREF